MLPAEKSSLRAQVVARRPGVIRWGDVAAVTLLVAFVLYVGVHVCLWITR